MERDRATGSAGATLRLTAECDPITVPTGTTDVVVFLTQDGDGWRVVTPPQGSQAYDAEQFRDLVAAT